MSQKEKKVFKKKLNVSPKVTFTNRWTNWRISESKSRFFYNQNILNNLLLKSLYKDKKNFSDDMELLLDFDLKIQYLFNAIKKKSSITKQKNYCSFIGRSRSINRKLFIARHTLRKFIRFGLMPGFIQQRC